MASRELETKFLSQASPDRPTIAVLMAKFGRVREKEFLSGVVAGAQEHDVNLVCLVGGSAPLDPRYPGGFEPYSLYRFANAPVVDGLVISSEVTQGAAGEEEHLFSEFIKSKPCITNTMGIEGAAHLVPDYYGGMRQIVKHLVEAHGKQRIAYLRGPVGEYAADQQFQAYLDVLSTRGVAYDPQLVVEGANSAESGKTAVSLLLDERRVVFDALVASSDQAASSALQALQGRGIQVPGEIALTGFEDDSDLRPLIASLTTTRHSSFLAGRQSVVLLLRKMQGETVPERVLQPAEMVVGSSCGCLPPAIQLAAVEGAYGSSQIEISQLFDIRRSAILSALRTAAGLPPLPKPRRHTTSSLSPIDPAISHLLDSFIADINQRSTGRFLKAVGELLLELDRFGKDPACGHALLSTLRREIIPYISQPEQVLRAENYLQQARMLAGEHERRCTSRQRMWDEQREALLQSLSFNLAPMVYLKELCPAETQHFPPLGIDHSFIALYANHPGDSAEAARPMPDLCHLLLDFHYGDVQYSPSGPPVATTDMIHRRIQTSSKPKLQVFMPLDLGDTPLGILGIEVGPLEWEIYSRIRNLFSSAIFRALLVKQREQAQQEVGRLLVDVSLQAGQLARAKEEAEESARQAHLALQETEGLFRAAQAIFGGTQVSDICEKLAVQFNELVQADSVAIFLVDHEQKKVILRVDNGAAFDFVDSNYESLCRGISGVIFRNKQPVLSLHAYDGIEPEETIARRMQAGIGPVIVVPLITKGNVIGVVAALNRTGSRIFTYHDVELLMSLATQAAAAIENARLYKSEQERRCVAESLVQAGRKLSSSLRLQDVPERILEQLAGVVPYERGSLMLREGDAVRIVAQHGYPADERLKTLRVSLREGDVFFQVTNTGKPVIIDDVTKTSGWQQVDWLPLNLSWIGVPLFSKDRVIGMLSLTRSPASAFSQDDAILISTFALQAAIALENAGLYEEITQFNEHLEQMVQRRTEELHQAYQTLEKLDRSKIDFINVAAHELRTPLTIMKGYTGMLYSDSLLQKNEYLLESVRGILQGTDRLHEIVNSMLDVARIDSQVLDMHPEITALFPLIKRVYADLQTDLEERKIRMHLADLSGLPLITADPSMLLKVFQNVVINAIKFTPNGGQIWISGCLVRDEQIGECIEVVIHDTGIGVDKEHQELIFEKFYQTGKAALHSSGRTKFKGGGPGLGLAIARGIVNAHRGKIWVESPGYDEQGCPGSTFYVRLPIRR